MRLCNELDAKVIYDETELEDKDLELAILLWLKDMDKNRPVFEQEEEILGGKESKTTKPQGGTINRQTAIF